MAEQKQEHLAPAYVPWRTLMNYIISLRESGLPSQINRSVMEKTSYSGQAQLLAGMRYLGLIDTHGTPQVILAQWVEADEANQTKIIGKILSDRYSFVFDNLDLARASPAEVDKQFRDRGIVGSTADRAVAFFLNAADAAGVALSPHLKKKNRSSSGAPRRTRPPRRKQSFNGTKPDSVTPPPAPRIPAGFQDLLLEKFPQFDPAWADALKQQWFEGFQKLMGMAPTPPKNTGDEK